MIDKSWKIILSSAAGAIGRAIRQTAQPFGYSRIKKNSGDAI